MPYQWYISHELLYFEAASSVSDQSGELTVWENLILLKAHDPEEAYQKALELGHANDQGVTIDGVEGRCKFRGLRDLVHIYDPLQDGAELEWHELQLTKDQLCSMVKRKRQMHAFKVAKRRVK